MPKVENGKVIETEQELAIWVSHAPQIIEDLIANCNENPRFPIAVQIKVALDRYNNFHRVEEMKVEYTPQTEMNAVTNELVYGVLPHLSNEEYFRLMDNAKLCLLLTNKWAYSA